jgi:uncharacterized protein YqjF (DUF2071 family)
MEKPRRPRLPWILRQTWSDLLFAHWPVEGGALARHLPPGLELDLFHGQAWLSMAAFDLEGLRFRAWPPIPGATHFLELNVRTYVHVGGVGGVFFFSLDAASALAVFGARASLRLAYQHAAMASRRDGATIHYESTRIAAPEVRFRATYTPSGPVAEAPPGSLDEWLVERYCLYTRMAGRIFRLDIEHRPWPLQRASATLETNTMALPVGLTLGAPEIVQFSQRLDVLAWPPHPVGTADRSL